MEDRGLKISLSDTPLYKLKKFINNFYRLEGKLNIATFENNVNNVRPLKFWSMGRERVMYVEIAYPEYYIGWGWDYTDAIGMWVFNPYKTIAVDFREMKGVMDLINDNDAILLESNGNMLRVNIYTLIDIKEVRKKVVELQAGDGEDPTLPKLDLIARYKVFLSNLQDLLKLRGDYYTVRLQLNNNTMNVKVDGKLELNDIPVEPIEYPYDPESGEPPSPPNVEASYDFSKFRMALNMLRAIKSHEFEIAFYRPITTFTTSNEHSIIEIMDNDRELRILIAPWIE